jgi:hypothetical protein
LLRRSISAQHASGNVRDIFLVTPMDFRPAPFRDPPRERFAFLSFGFIAITHLPFYTKNHHFQFLLPFSNVEGA